MNRKSPQRAGVSFRSARTRGPARRVLPIGGAAALAVTACGLAAGHPAAAAPTAGTPAATPAAAAPFVYVADKGRNEISQFGGAPGGSGALRPLTPRNVASGPFPSGIAVSPRGTSVYVVDTGAVSAPAAEVSQYTISPATGKLTPKSPATVATGNDPAAIAVAPDGKNAYVAASGPNTTTGTISQYRISPATGKLTPLSPATVATPGSPDSGSVKVAPDGKNLYVTNTKTNTIAQYRISPATGALSSKSPATVPTAPGPHDLAITPDGTSAYVVTVASNTVSQYAITPRTGALSSRPVSTAATGLHPEAIVIAPDGKNAYVTSENKGTLSQYAISPATGKITPLSPATITTPPSGSIGLAITPAADLSAKASAPATARHGQALTFTITITDTGPSQSWQATLTDHLPAGTAFRSATTAHGHCSHPRAGTRGATVRCHPGTLRAGAAWRIHIKVTVKASTGTIRDKATVTSVTPDPHPGNNTATTATKITG